MDACSVHWARGGVMLWLEVTAAASVVPSTRGATRSAMRRGDGGGRASGEVGAWRWCGEAQAGGEVVVGAARFWKTGAATEG